MSSSTVFVWVNASESMQYFPNIFTDWEPPMIKDLHMVKDNFCMMFQMNKYVDLSKFQPRYINGYLFITCPDIRMLTTNGFIPKCRYFPYPESEHSKPIQISPLNASNPYGVPSAVVYSSSCSVINMLIQDDDVKKEMVKKKRKARCLQLKSICEDKSSILSGLIQLAYVSCMHCYGPDAIHKVPGIIYSEIIDNISKCGKFMNQTMTDIYAILSIIDEVSESRRLKSYCQTLIKMWTDIEDWLKNHGENLSEVFNDLAPKMYEYIEYFQEFAFMYNKSKINTEPLSAVGLINQFIEKNKKF